MMILSFIWWLDVVDKLRRKHRVTTGEVIEIFRDAPTYRRVQKGVHAREHLYAAMGRTESGRYLVVFFVYKRDRQAMVISGRDMNTAERRRYAHK